MDRLLKKINSQNNPILVPVKVEEYSKPDNCFFNVKEKVSKDKGEIIYGWKLYQTQLLLEAERHAVWKSPLGELIDISPDSANSNSIVFIQEDNGWIYNGYYSDNVRVNITNNPLVDDFILLSETVTKLYQTGKRESEYGVSLLEPVHKLIIFFEQDKVLRQQFILSGNSTNDVCYCGSTLKYKDCHGNNLDSIYSDILEKIQILTRVKS
ncbi:MAG: hypothetical protein RL308_98 [Bacteroidota bacterium]|jgi:hypothetical protein